MGGRIVGESKRLKNGVGREEEGEVAGDISG